MPSTRVDWPRTLAVRANRSLKAADLRWRTLPAGSAMLHCILLDCSASMLEGDQLGFAKGLLQQWVRQLYRRREYLAVIGFAGDTARLLQPPHKAVAFNDAWISAIPGGGATPARAAVALADAILGRWRRRVPGQRITVWLLSDARFNALPPRPRFAHHCVVVDFDRAAVALGRARHIAEAWGAELLRAADLAQR